MWVNVSICTITTIILLHIPINHLICNIINYFDYIEKEIYILRYDKLCCITCLWVLEKKMNKYNSYKYFTKIKAHKFGFR